MPWENQDGSTKKRELGARGMVSKRLLSVLRGDVLILNDGLQLEKDDRAWREVSWILQTGSS